MLFQRKKKKQLWRLASKNENSPNNESKSQLTEREQNADASAARLRLSKNSSCSCVELETECPHCSTPPPPYDCIDFNETPFSSVSNLICDREECNFGEASYHDITKRVNFHKYSYTISDDVADDNCDPYDVQSILENSEDSQPIALKKTKFAEAERKTKTPIQLGEAAINIFRFCCTCGSQSRNSSNSSLNKCTLAEKTPLTASRCESLEAEDVTNRDFKLLMKILKNYQISLLLEAVQFRKTLTPAPSGGVGEYLNCILMKRSLWENEEPFLATCRLFFWSDLKTSKDIKRTPLCKSEHNKDSVCCNPLHWCRIIVTDGDSPTLDLVDNLYAKTKPSYSKSYTTHNESISTLKKGWCEVAYWELARRVGLRQVIKCNTFNIGHEDNPVMMDAQNVCLKTFFNSYKSSGNDVRIIRQRIGYGVSISKEEDGIWLYNISSVPIFLHSPTLCESWFRVLKVLPGNCVKAFDYFGPVEFSCQMQLPTLEVGPYETRTIRFSFVKGWGRGYKRQDITRCPCWLEIFIKDRP